MVDLTKLKDSLVSDHKTDIDDIIHNESGITIVAARPGMGKSFLMMTLAMRWAEQNKSVLYLSEYGDNYKQQTLVLLANHLFPPNNNSNLKTAFLTEWEESYNTYLQNYFTKNNLTIIHDTEFTDDCLDTILRHLEDVGKPDIVFIDGFSKIRRTSTDNYTAESYHDLIVKVSYLQRALQIPIVITGQVSENLEDKDDKEPYPADIVNNHILSRYCDSIITIFRPSYYDFLNKHDNKESYPDQLNFYTTNDLGLGREQVKFDYDTMKINFNNSYS